MPEEIVRRLFLCRHGQSEDNEKRVYAGGESDSPLSQTGKIQAELLGKALNHYYKFCGEIIATSNIGRAKETADIVSKHLKARPRKMAIDGLKELNIGEWAGKTSKEVEKLFPSQHKEWRFGPLKPDFRFPKGDSLEVFRKRILKSFIIIKDLWLHQENNDLIIIGHGGTNSVILMEFLGAKLETFRIIRQSNACVNIICFLENSIWRPDTDVLLVNSTHHLDMPLPIN